MKPEYNENRRNKRILAAQQGLCYTCYNKPAIPDRRNCVACLESKRNVYNKQLESGVCPICKKNAAPGRVHCKVCAVSRNLKNKELKLHVIEQYGGKCNCCGETNILFLTVDHINGGGNLHREQEFGKKNICGARMYAWLKKNNFPASFQILCWNCNNGKFLNYGICPHTGG